ncbi:MAG: type I-U CRISPR-associated protein Csb2 [Thermoguttaceae bacterium]
MTHLRLSVRFLDDRYHGLLGRGGPPEWPPSPFRLFQALVAGVARQGQLVIGEDAPTNKNFTQIGKALDWLQRHTREYPPIIIAPKSRTGQAITRFVPNNDGDEKFDRQERLTAKPTIPTLFLLEKDQRPEVHYVWRLGQADGCPIAEIERAARSLTTLGWGIDMAFADARLADEAELQKLKGIRWYAKKNAGSFNDTLRTPTYDDDLGESTLDDLRRCHSTFVNRIEHGKPLKTVDKPKVFDRVLYTSVERPIGRPHFVFKLLDDELDTTRYPNALLAHIAAVVRHAAIECMEEGRNAPSWILQAERGPWVNRFVRGKNEPQRDDHQQISYVPLPSIGHEHADAMVRNVMLIAPIGREEELEHVAKRLDGVPLEFKDAGEECDICTRPRVPLPRSLQRFTPPRGKFIDKCYLGRARVWQSVTPVILDEHIDKKTRETRDGQKVKCRDPEDFERLIVLALQRAGIETPCKFTWQTLPFYKNCVTAHRYDRNKRPNFVLPKRLDGKTAVHLRLTFEREVPGPFTLGAGRHCGFGLFAAVDRDE